MSLLCSLKGRKYRLVLLLAVGVVLCWRLWPREPSFRPLDRVPNRLGGGRLDLRNRQMTLHLRGSPEAMGAQHGRLLRRSIRWMLKAYVWEIVCGRDRRTLNDLLGRVRTMKPSLPAWYLTELSACARAAAVEEDELLLAQCEGDIQAVHPPRLQRKAACSGYVVFDRQQITGGDMLVGRNLDYYGGNLVHHCSLITYYRPREEDGYPFVAVGCTGILGGWTLVNSRGLVVANHLGGGSKTNPRGVPTLVMSRLLAQKCATIQEALALLRRSPRMRGQILWMAQPADKQRRRPGRAVAAEFDAKDFRLQEAQDGILIITNANHCFRRAFLGHKDASSRDSVYAALLMAIRRHTPNGPRIITRTANISTLHSVEIDFGENCLYVSHNPWPAQDAKFVRHRLPPPRGGDRVLFPFRPSPHSTLKGT